VTGHHEAGKAMTDCAFVEWSEGLNPTGTNWDVLREQIFSLRPDILVTNELPFGNWLPSSGPFDKNAALRSIADHERGLEALIALNVPSIISSRPAWAAQRLANEAFVLDRGRVHLLHRKQYFPDEDGWRESAWFEADGSGFAIYEIESLKIGVLLCTELMFNERARHYGRSGADLIVVPRATGYAHHLWKTAGAMAAAISGSYVISSNRVGQSPNSPAFGGCGFAFAPDGLLLAESSPERPLVAVKIDVAKSRRQKLQYPCYLMER
jgi:N-carbamoylputrescine amidase